MPIVPGPDGALPYRAFLRRHPEHHARYWRKLRALYRGGRDVLCAETITEILARNNNESDQVYAWRCAQAFYLNYCSEIIDHIAAGLAGDSPRVTREGDQATEDDPIVRWAQDVSPADAELETDLDALIKAIALEALQVRTAWVLLDRPPADPALGEPQSLGEAERAGLTRCCTRVVPAEEVLHWEIDPVSRRLRWALVGTVDVTYPEFYGPPTIIETFTRYEAETFTQWSVSYLAGSPPKPQDQVARIVDAAEHGFERVPLRRFELPAGLWAMDKLESVARAIFNKWNLLDIAERRSLLPVLYEFLGAEMASMKTTVSVAQKDPSRPFRTARSASTVQVRGKDDRAEFVGPDSGPFTHVRDSIGTLRDEAHRVLYQMALATDPQSAAAVGRSAESKQEDNASTSVILKAIGKLMLAFLQSLVPDVLHVAGVSDGAAAVEAGKAYAFVGLTKFDDVGEADLVAQTAELALMNIPSPTAQREVFMRLLRRIFDSMTEDTLAKMGLEIDENLSPEAMLKNPATLALVKQAVDGYVGSVLDPGVPSKIEPEEDDEGDDEEEAARPPGAVKKTPPAGKARPMVDTAAQKGRRR
jgi:hypothetical protein